MPRALIVEDEPEANKLLGMLLRLRGYQTDAAFNGRQALELVAQSPPDIIFLDLMLPDLNGYEVCKILKSAKGTSLIPLVIITARIAAENRIESFCLGADDYIAKPYTPDQIYQSVDQALRWLDQSRAGAIQGQIAFEQDDDGEILRRLGQLRSLIFARTPLRLDEVVHIGRAIKEVWCQADVSASSSREQTMTLAYTLTPDRLVLHFQGASLRLSRILELVDDATNSLHIAAFDVVKINDAGHSLTISKNLPRDE
ncbi:MAG: response regulator transcription factor [Isosphaeraceae bacterium]